MTERDIAIASIKTNEGFSAKPYQCPAGKTTIGYGFNMEAADDDLKKLLYRLTCEYYLTFPSKVDSQADFLFTFVTEGINEEIAEEILEHQVDNIIKIILGSPRSVDWYESLSENRRAIIVEMVYQLGFRGMMSFQRMILAIKQKDWHATAAEMRASKWYQQTKKRCLTLAYRMKEDL